MRKYIHISMNIYTDGSCLGNPGPGGWAAACDNFVISGAEEHTTNNRMELTAVERALQKCLDMGLFHIFVWTDSTYVKNGITLWIHGWKRNGWKTAGGGDVKNKDIWVKIDALLYRMKNVQWRWVKAHNGHPMNEKVDTLAREQAKNICVK
jgi:ribonuclease HI